VPAGEGWTRGVWGEAAGDRIYGRGATDDKGPAMACLYALRALIASGAPVKNRLRLLFGCDEETGMGDMRNYLARRKAPDYAFSPDATFPVIHAEKGIVSGAFYADIPQPTALVSLTGGVRLNVVPAFAQAQLRGVGVGRLAAAVERRAHILLVVENHEIFVKSEGVPAHASTPWKGRNAITQLAEYLTDVLPEGDGAMPYMRALARNLSPDGAGLHIACRDDVSGPLTFNLGMADLTGGRLTLSFDIRHPVTLDIAPILERLNAALSEMGFTMAPTVSQPGLHLPCDHPLVAALSRVYARATGRRSKPIAIGGGTYARTLPCAVAFGPVFPGRAETAHMADEYADVSDLMAAARVYALAMAELGNL
jgi:succinyl-diaminopimelate desuccinylase